MAIPKITGAQRDFTSGELDPQIKRGDDNAAQKTGARQMLNWRILSSKGVANRPGRTALFPEAGRVEKITMSPGNVFYLVFGNGYLRVYNAVGTQVFTTNVKGDGATAIPWTSATVPAITWDISDKSIYIAYADGAPLNVPQILTWDGVSQTSTWTLATFAETNIGGSQKRTLFYRISPKGVTMALGATTGATSIAFSANILVAGMIGTRFLFCGSQVTLTGVTNPALGAVLIDQVIPPAQQLGFAVSSGGFNLGQEVIGSVTGAKGIITASVAGTITVQLIPTGTGNINFFTTADTAVSPTGNIVVNAVANILPQPVVEWSDEVMNNFRGFPSSVFFDQNRLGFCNFPAVTGGIGWSAIGTPTDFYVEIFVSPATAIFEIAPNKSQVLYVVPGMESSEFVFCDNANYYIPITATDPLTPASVAFNLLSKVGCQPGVQPRSAGQVVVYVKPGGISIGAVQAPGAFNRPYVIDDVSENHSHLFAASAAVAIAAPPASSQYEEHYLYIVLANGTMVVGKYAVHNGMLETGQESKPKIGWLPWNGSGTVSYASARDTDVIFTSNYTPNAIPAVHIVERLDNLQYLDSAMAVNSMPTPFVTGGKGPLFVFAGGAVTLLDLVTRQMGTYQVDANGNIVPQNIGGENLASAQLVAGFDWTAVLEPFVPDAQPGQSVHQRMFKRRVSRMAVYVMNSTGFLMARLFSGPLTRTSPALGTIMNTRRITTYNQDDDPTLPPPQREEAQRWRPLGRSYDPRVAIIKDTPGPLLIAEVGIEASI